MLDNRTDASYMAEHMLYEVLLFDPRPDSCSKPDIRECSFKLRHWQGQFFYWLDSKYMPWADTEMRSFIANQIQANNFKEVSGGFCTGERYIKSTNRLVTDIMLYLSGNQGVHLPPNQKLNTWDDDRTGVGEETLSFFNTLLKIPLAGEPEQLPHTPKFFNISHIPYNYDKDAKCPSWEKFLDEVMEGDTERITLLQQWAGYLFISDNCLQKFMLIAGEGANGKTVFTTVIEMLVGEDNVCHIPLSQYSQQFALSGMLGKMLNSTSESSHRLDESAETALKSITSGDRMTFHRKYKEPVHTEPTVKVMISTNQLPNFADKSSGIWRRMLFVPFEVTIPENKQNPSLIYELSKERLGIFNWAMEGLRNLRKNKRFIEPARCKRAIEEYRRDVNPARAFLLDNYTPSLCSEPISCKSLYDKYVEYCFESGYRPMNASNFGKEVKRAFPNIGVAHLRSGENRERAYEGIEKAYEMNAGYVR